MVRGHRMAPRRTAAGAAAVKRMREIADANDAEMVGAERAVNAAASDSAVALALQQRAALYIARGRKAEALADLRRAVALDQRRPRDSAGQCRRVCLALAWRVYVTALALAVALLAISALLSLVGGMEGGWVTSRLYSAAERGDLDTVTALLQAGAPAGDPAALAFPLVIARRPTSHGPPVYPRQGYLTGGERRGRTSIRKHLWPQLPSRATAQSW